MSFEPKWRYDADINQIEDTVFTLDAFPASNQEYFACQAIVSPLH